MTYEGGGSINGQYLGSLGATAAAISIIAGFGEFLRSVAVADKTGRYWFITLIGYALNALSVPAVALAGSWQLAAVFILLERIGHALRKPTVEAMLSYTTDQLAKGWVYGLNTALDETGATASIRTASRALVNHDRAAVYPNRARKIAAAHAIQLSHSGIKRVPHGVVTAMGQPSTARANCKTAITAKTIAAMRA